MIHRNKRDLLQFYDYYRAIKIKLIIFALKENSVLINMKVRIFA